jgi:hypothetical protein
MKKYIINSLKVWRYSSNEKLPFILGLYVVVEKLNFCIILGTLALNLYFFTNDLPNFLELKKYNKAIKANCLIVTYIHQGGFRNGSPSITGYLQDDIKKESHEVSILVSKGLVTDEEKVQRKLFLSNLKVNDTINVWYCKKNRYTDVKFKNDLNYLFDFKLRELIYNVKYPSILMLISFILQILSQQGRLSIEKKLKK